MITAPLRRCLVTQRVLPKTQLLKFKVAALPQQPTRPVIVPEILQQRYGGRMPGKSAWVLCRKEAVAALMKSGGYKRMNPQATMPEYTPIRIRVDLIQRVIDECKLLCARAQTRPKDSLCPIVLLSDEEFGLTQSIEWDKSIRGRKAVALFRISANSENPTSISDPDRTLHLHRAKDEPTKSGTKKLPSGIICYDLVQEAALYSSIRLPAPEDDRLNDVNLDREMGLAECIRIFAQRGNLVSRTEKQTHARDVSLPLPTGPAPQAEKEPDEDSVKTLTYAIYDGDQDTVSLLLALWRLWAWEGGGWKV